MTVPSVVGKTCPYCQTPIKPNVDVVVCNTCGMPHHQECWMENGRCTTFGCNGTPQQVSGAGVITSLSVQPMAAISMPPPPQMAMTYAPVQAPVAQDMYIEANNILIVRDGAMLPDVCVVTGNTTNLVRRQRLESWVPSWVGFIYLAGILVGAIVSAVMRKSGRIHYAIEKECAAQRLKLLLLNWGIFLALIGGMIASFCYESTVGLGAFLLLAAIIAPAIVYYVGIRLYAIQKIENGYLWIKFRKPEISQALYAAYLNQHRL